jgi:deferrochelatase/peroxidase EfeB
MLLLTQTESSTPNYLAEPVGAVVLQDSHIPLADPHQTSGSGILRRAYNDDRGTVDGGDLGMAPIFTCHQPNPVRQFVAALTRLIDEPRLRQSLRRRLPLHPARVRDSSNYFGRGTLA